jgi:hypothetical protein
MIITNVYFETKEFNQLATKLKKMRLIKETRDLVEKYKEYGVNNDIKFDNKWWLIGFNNLVYDLKKGEFR